MDLIEKLTEAARRCEDLNRNSQGITVEARLTSVGIRVEARRLERGGWKKNAIVIHWPQLTVASINPLMRMVEDAYASVRP